jgi:hypothetical protein
MMTVMELEKERKMRMSEYFRMSDAAVKDELSEGKQEFCSRKYQNEC